VTLAAGALTAGAIGCGDSVRPHDVEGKIRRNLERQLPGRKVTVGCPGGQRAGRGTTFTCRLKIDGVGAVADVRMLGGRRFTFTVHRRG
jgi:hypothetical protein